MPPHKTLLFVCPCPYPYCSIDPIIPHDLFIDLIRFRLRIDFIPKIQKPLLIGIHQSLSSKSTFSSSQCFSSVNVLSRQFRHNVPCPMWLLLSPVGPCISSSGHSCLVPMVCIQSCCAHDVRFDTQHLQCCHVALHSSTFSTLSPVSFLPPQPRLLFGFSLFSLVTC